VKRQPLFVTLTCVWAALYAMLGERMLLSLGVGGGRGLLPFGAVLSAMLLPFLWLAAARLRDRSAVKATVDPPTVFLGAAALLPLLGVVFGYAPRTLVASVIPLASLSFLILGRIIARVSLPRAISTTWLILTVIAWAQAAAALLQTLYWRRVALPGASALVAWDTAVARLLGTELITGRSAGFYVNPNVLSLMAGIGLVFGIAAPLRPHQRVLLIIPSALALGLGQSRGVMVALLAAITVELLALIAAGKLRPRVLGYIAAGLGAAAGGFILLQRIAPEQTARLTTRVGSALGSTAPGGALDANLGGRFDFWRRAVSVLAERPLGTFGPPESVLGIPTDSDVVRMALQGGAILIGLYIWALAWAVRKSDKSVCVLTRALTVFLGVASLTMNASTYPPAVFGVWIVLGIATASESIGSPEIQAA